MGQYDFDRLLQKYISGECSPVEEMKVLEWYNHLIRQSAVDISDNEKEMIQSRIWTKLSGGISAEPVSALQLQARSNSSRTMFYRVAIAASIILFVSFGLYYYWPANQASIISATIDTSIPVSGNAYTNNNKFEQEITLTDGSIAVLQPGATLVYPTVFAGNVREVNLTGNAFFKVFHNPAKHFLVRTQGLVTEVLGTSFHIRQDQSAGKLEIAVVTGKVSVYQEDKIKQETGDTLQRDGVILTPNQKVTYNSTNSQFITSLVEEPKPVAEYDKNSMASFVFEDVRLAKVLQALSKGYGIEILTESRNLANCHFTGDITKQDLYKKLEIICQSFQSSYEVKGTQIIIKGKGCK